MKIKKEKKKKINNKQKIIKIKKKLKKINNKKYLKIKIKIVFSSCVCTFS